MSDNIQDAILPILARIQSDIGAFRRESNDRLDRLEEAVKKHRRDSAGMLVMMRATVTDFDARVSEIEERMSAYDKRQ
jgi:hypothetical protein